MTAYTIKTVYMDVVDGELHKGQYADGSLALFVTDDGSREKLSINLGHYDLVAPAGHIYVKGNAEHKGLPEALENLGIASKVPNGRRNFGPFDAYAWLMKVEV